MRLSVQDAVHMYKDNVFRAAYYICKNRPDAEDICQETFLAYFKDSTEFESEEHVKAWLLRTAINRSRSLFRQLWRRNTEPLEEYMEFTEEKKDSYADLLSAVLSLPVRCRTIVHLFYYEDYKIREISQLLGISEGAVKSQLNRGRALLKEKLQEEWNDEE